MEPRTFLDLCYVMRTRAVVTFRKAAGDVTGIIKAIEPQDESGYSYNVTVQPRVTPDSPLCGSDSVTVFVRMEN